MKPLWLTFVFLLLTATVSVAQRPSQNDSQPRTPPAASSPAPAPSAPSTSTYNGGGGGSTHSSPAPPNSGGSMGGSSSQTSRGNPGADRAGSGSSHTRTDRSNPGGNNPSRFDRSSTNNSRATENRGFSAEGTRTTPTDRRTHPNSPRPDLPSPAAGASQPGRDNRQDPNANRDLRSDPALNKRIAPPRQSSGDTKREKHFHWFWQRPPKNTEETDLAKRGHPDLRKPTPCKGMNCTPACPAGQARGENGRCGPAVPIHNNCTGSIDSAGNCIEAVPCANTANPYDPNCQQNNGLYANRPDCSALASEIAQIKLRIEELRQHEQLVCAPNPSTQECQRTREELRQLQEQLMHLQTQNATCMNMRSQHP